MNKIEITNVKAIKEKSFEWPEGTQLLLFKGKNQTGKSTIAQVLRVILQVKNDMKDTVTKGENSSKVLYRSVNKNGNPMTIEWSHENDKDKFKCTIIGKTGMKNITSVNNIRDVIGNHFHYTAQDIFNLLSTSQGRKKFMDEFVLSQMNENDKVNYIDHVLSISDKKSTRTEGNRYFTRRKLNQEIELLSASLSNVPEWNTDKERKLNDLKLKSDIETPQNNIYNKERLINDSKNVITDIIDDYQHTVKRIESLKESGVLIHSAIELPQLKNVVQNRLGELKDVISKLESEILTEKLKITVAKDNFSVIAELENDKKVYERSDEVRKQIESLSEDIEKINQEIENSKANIKAILERTKLPSGLVLNDDEVLLNGLKFDEMSISDSEARLAIIEMLASINESHFCDIGDTTVYDNENFKKLLSIASKHNCTLLAQQVTNDENLEFEIITHES